MKTKFLSVAALAFGLFFTSNVTAQNVFPSTGNVGLGTTTPAQKLEIVGTGMDSYIHVRRVGISTAPYGSAGIKIGAYGTLSVAGYPAYGSGTLQITNSTSAINIGNGGRVHFGGLPGAGYGSGDFSFNGTAWAKNMVVAEFSSPGPSPFSPPAGYKFTVAGKSYFTGYVGIGTSCTPTDATVRLGVKGTVLCEELRIKKENGTCWADFVFDKDYKLRSLEEVEKFIMENKHLPEIPSALEVGENGIEMSEMLKLQMQKIEELTLYMIDMKKEINELKKENTILKADNK